MKRTITVLRRNALFKLTFMLILFSSYTQASDIVEILPVTERVIMLHFDDGSVDYHDQLGELWQDDVYVNNPLDSAGSLNLLSYLVSSADDANYASGLNPIQVGRKSRSTENPGHWPDYPYIKEHWVYLVLPHKMERGKTYTINLGSLAANMSEISITFDEFTNRSEVVHVNNVGYTPQARKKFAYLNQWMGTLGPVDLSDYVGRDFHLVDVAGGGIAFTGQVAFRKSNSVENQHGDRYYNTDMWECDFSTFSGSGEYKVVVEGIGSSFPFKVSTDSYKEAYYVTTRGLYHHRSGPARGEPYSAWPKAEDHMPGVNGHKVLYSNFRWMDHTGQNEIFVDLPAAATTTEMPNAWGGWMDAGDYDRYPDHLIIVNQLLTVYEFNPGKFSDGDLNIPESGNGIPDIIDECQFEVDFYLRMKGPTGGISGGLETSSHPHAGTNSATDELKTWYQYAEEPLASFWTAACAAQLAYALNTAGRSDLSGYYIDEAKAIFEWAQNNLKDGDLGLKGTQDKRMLAAAWLFKVTGKEQYQTQFKADNKVNSGSAQLDNYLGPEFYNQEYAVWAYATTNQPNIDQTLKSTLIEATLNWASKENVTAGQNRACRQAQRWDLPTVIGFGSSTPIIMPLIVAHHISGDETYRDYIYTTCDYFLGANPLNMTMVTGLGERRPEEVLSHDGWYDGIDDPIPGIVPYAYIDADLVGSNSWYGTWAPGYHYLSSYPSHESWPINEKYYDTRYCGILGEYTIWQNIGPAAAAYAYLLEDKNAGGIIPVTGINIIPTSLTLSINKKSQLTTVFAPSNATNKGISWSSSDTAVVKVDGSGLATGVGEGTAIVTATSSDGGFTATSEITVLPLEDKLIIDFDNIVPSVEVIETGKIQMYAPGGTSSIADNPMVNENNGSGKVGQFNRDEGGWKLIGFNLPEGIKVKGFESFQFKLLGTGLNEIYVQLKDEAGNMIRDEIKTIDINDEWGLVTINFPNGVDATLKEFNLFPNPGTPAAATYYLDDFVVSIGGNIDVPVTGVSVTPSSDSVEVGQTVQLATNITPFNASNKAISWSSADENIATVSANGQVTGVNAGTVMITATTNDGGFTSAATIEVVSGEKAKTTLVDFDIIIPTESVVEPGKVQMYGAGGKATNADNPVVNSDNPSAKVGQFKRDAGTWKLMGFVLPEGIPLNGFKTFEFQIYGTGITQVYVQVKDDAGNMIKDEMKSVNIDGEWGTIVIELPDTVSASLKEFNVFPNPNNPDSATYFVDNFLIDLPAIAVSGVSVNPTSGTLSIGETLQLSAMVSPLDADDPSVVWASNNEAVATVDANGLVTATGLGIAEITVTTNDGGFTAFSSIEVEVKSDKLLVDFDNIIPSEGVIEPGKVQMYASAGTAKNADNPFVDGNNGSAKVGHFARGEGVWKLIGFSLPNPISLKDYTSFDFQLYGSGLIQVYVQVKDEAGVMIKEEVKTISIDNEWGWVSIELPAGVEAKLKEFNIFPNPNNAEAADYYLDNFQIKLGGAAVVSVTGISVLPTSATVEEGATLQLAATITPGDATDKSVIWASDNEAVATVDVNGLVTTLSPGNAIISVTTNDGGFVAETDLEVTKIPTGGEGVFQQGNDENGIVSMEAEHFTQRFEGTGDFEGANWEEFEDAAASNGKYMVVPDMEDQYAGRFLTGPALRFNVNFVKEGTHYIWLRVITPSPADDSVNPVFDGGLLGQWFIGEHAEWTWVKSGFTFEATPGQHSFDLFMREDGTLIDKVVLTSNDSYSVDGLGPDESDNGGGPQDIPLMGISVDKNMSEIVVGATDQLSVIFDPVDATNQKVEWSSDNEAIALVDENGLVTALAEGTAVITATAEEGGFTATSSINVLSAPCTASGTILYQRFDGIPGGKMSSLTDHPDYPQNPTAFLQLNKFETPQNVGDGYGAKISGLLCAPESGNYTFWIAGDNKTELWLSTDDEPANISKIAYSNKTTKVGQWDKLTTQMSVEISLEQGESYYLEALLKENKGKDFMAVGWRKPSDGEGTSPVEIIPGSVLSPTEFVIVPVAGININPLSDEIYIGGTAQFSAAVVPANANNQNFTWASSDESVATIDANGYIVGLKEGTTTISATSEDGGFVASASLTVKGMGICSSVGTILYERYDQIIGNKVSDLTNSSDFPYNPDFSEELPFFSVPQNACDSCGVRVSGYICAPQTGNFTFWIAGDGRTELWLSSTGNPMQKELIAYHNKTGKPGEYDKSSSQQSYEIAMVEGQKYYIEALMKENKGKDHLSVSWLMPDGTKETPISGIHLSPANNPGADVPVKYEAELANLSGVLVNTAIDDFSGTGYVEQFTDSENKVSFTVESSKTDAQNLTVGYAASGGDNTKEVFVNGNSLGSFTFYASSAFSEINLGNIDLNEGQNTIEIAHTSGDIQLDYILVGGSYPNSRKAALVIPEAVEAETESEISMYPNPVKSTLTILLKDDWRGNVGIRVLNLVCQEVKVFEMEKTQKASRHQLDLQGLQNGIYMVELQMGEKRIINRVVVQQ